MPRFQRILFPVDFSERSRAAAPFVLSMAQRYAARVDVFHVVQPPPPLYAGMNAVYPEAFDFEGIAADLRLELEKFVAAELPKINAVCTVESGDPAIAIANYATENGTDLIAMPTHGYGAFRRALLGSVTAKVLHDADIPMWTAAHAPEPSHRAHPKPRHILCALDLKPEGRQTLEFAIEVARDADASVELLHGATEGEIAAAGTEHRLQELLAEAARSGMVKVEEAAGTDVVTAMGSVADLVRSVALRKRADLVVIGAAATPGWTVCGPTPTPSSAKRPARFSAYKAPQALLT
jgi:nucleotide-binding universal stress UspA family protein